ncbi:hypothetical protein DM860_014896 [Cuscuta australis]|uniref:Fungal lipase-like domain-containing protein n=1 Tax=Cuscuta australis TaxID=267555 RepID=A0A328E629_9ASTE|nr:hypothetical protein DM860_014896 [Cuscuta australis]
MSFACCLPTVQCVYCLGCAHWARKKFYYTAGRESENWRLATPGEFEPVPRICRYILSVYEDDLRNPLWAPPGGYGVDYEWVVAKRNYDDTRGKVAPYMIYLDHENEEIVLAFRGLDLAKESDYLVLLDDKLGQAKFDGGFVHNGLLKSAQWVVDKDSKLLGELIAGHPNYTLTLAGHSLGAGVATMLTMLAAKNGERFGNIERRMIKCFSVAPTRCVSLDLAMRYADVISSVVLQDDFLPRTRLGQENAFKTLFCLPCVLCIMCLKDTFMVEEKKKLKDPRSLYIPGRLYHIIARERFSSTDIPPIVKTCIQVDGRFESIVVSCNMMTDHAIMCILTESERTLDNAGERRCHVYSRATENEAIGKGISSRRHDQKRKLG